MIFPYFLSYDLILTECCDMGLHYEILEMNNSVIAYIYSMMFVDNGVIQDNVNVISRLEGTPEI